VTITTVEMTPTQRLARQRRRAFRESIEAHAVLQKPSADRPVGIKGHEVQTPQPFEVIAKPLPRFVPSMVWPAIPPALGADPTIRQIQKEVVKHYDIELADMTSDRRTWDVSHPRQVAMYLAKTLTKHSLPYIGRRFGGRDHTNVLHGVRKVAKHLETGSQIARDVESILIQLTAVSHAGGADSDRDALMAEEDGHSTDRQDDSHQRGSGPSGSDHRPGASV
jgi:hypothetical protein